MAIAIDYIRAQGRAVTKKVGPTARLSFFHSFLFSTKYTLISVEGLGLASGGSRLEGARPFIPVFVEDRGICMPS
jgi:hypothetical protein